MKSDTRPRIHPPALQALPARAIGPTDPIRQGGLAANPAAPSDGIRDGRQGAEQAHGVITWADTPKHGVATR